MHAEPILPSDTGWPRQLTARLGAAAPTVLYAVGPASILSGQKIAIFCSAHTSGEAILRAHDVTRRMRDDGVTVISGFHSPIEKECLKILLRGRQPVIMCPARAIDSMRIPRECHTAFDAGRILFLSRFTQKPKRVTAESALRRNELVAALADEAYIAHIESGGKTHQILSKLKEWNVPIL